MTPEVRAAGYCATPGLVFSHPVVCARGGDFSVAAGLHLDEFSRGMLAATERELSEERDLATVAAAAEAAAAAK